MTNDTIDRRHSYAINPPNQIALVLGVLVHFLVGLIVAMGVFALIALFIPAYWNWIHVAATIATLGLRAILARKRGNCVSWAVISGVAIGLVVLMQIRNLTPRIVEAVRNRIVYEGQKAADTIAPPRSPLKLPTDPKVLDVVLADKWDRLEYEMDDLGRFHIYERLDRGPIARPLNAQVLEQVRRQVTELHEDQLNSLKHENLQLRSDNDVLVGKTGALSAENKRLSSSARQLEATNDRLTRDLVGALGEVDSQKRQIRDLTSAMDATEMARAKAADEFVKAQELYRVDQDRLNSALKDALAEYHWLNQELERNREECTQLHIRIATLEAADSLQRWIKYQTHIASPLKGGADARRLAQ